MKKIKIWDKVLVVFILILWQIAGSFEWVPSFMLPTPVKILTALWQDKTLIWDNLLITLSEAAIGMAASLVFAFVIAVLMDRVKIFYDMFYPLCVVSQTVPTVAIAPILVLWFGFGMMPKVLLVFLTCFFPIVVSLLGGFKTADENIIKLYKSMSASYWKILIDVKIPYAAESFFSGLRISASYAIVGAVIAEWLGGNGGLGVYMTRVRESFRFDRMFAVIIVISVLSLLLMKIIKIIEKKSMPWKK
ncbi:MAG: ABC transporter permease [Clostridia bacterium]|nr:ABC transporter permease [Clostridia bacterium]